MISEQMGKDSATVQESNDVRRYHCNVRVYDEGDVFAAEIANLPGVASQGASEDDAIENLKEAFSAVLAEYDLMEVAIPWSDDTVDTPDEPYRQLWVMMDA